MKSEFIERIFKILDTYFPDETIVNSIESLKNKTKLEFYAVLRNYFVVYKIEESIRNTKFAKWIEKFLNSNVGEDIKLEKFELFFKEIEKLLDTNGFSIENMSHFDIEYNVFTPEQVKRQKDDYEEMLSDKNEAPYQKEYEESTKKESIFALKYQNLLTDLYINIQEYILLTHKYIDKKTTLINPKDEKSFRTSIEQIQSKITTLSFAFPSFNTFKYQLSIRIPFNSLYSFEKDWVDAITRDRKNIFDEGLIKSSQNELNFLSIRDLIKPIEQRVINLLTEESINLISDQVKDLQVIDALPNNLIEIRKAFYDFENSILYIDKDFFEFKIDGNEDKILKIIFGKPKEIHVYTKMIRLFDPSFERDNVDNGTISDIVSIIKRKLKQKGFDDFLIKPRSGTVKINPLYEIS